MARSLDAGRPPTSDKANHSLGLSHSEGNTILKGSLKEHRHDRILIKSWNSSVAATK
jgi:hypothetical protein